MNYRQEQEQGYENAKFEKVSLFFSRVDIASKLCGEKSYFFKEARDLLARFYPYFNQISDDPRDLHGSKKLTKFTLLIVFALSEGLKVTEGRFESSDSRYLPNYVGSLIETQGNISEVVCEGLSYENGIELLAQAIEGLESLGR